MSVFNANLQITKSKVKNGEIVDLEINGQNIELGSEMPMDANKEQTIDVSTYTEPVAITPSSGKKGMKKATVTLSNIPEANDKLYAWVDSNDPVEDKAFTITETPTTSNKTFFTDADGVYAVSPITAVGENTITTNEVTLTRDPTYDVTL